MAKLECNCYFLRYWRGWKEDEINGGENDRKLVSHVFCSVLSTDLRPLTFLMMIKLS